MRVISGRFRGRKLRSEADIVLRPMLDRVKEALFNIIQGFIRDSVTLDLFSGSGSLGIEALSRGASYCMFVEKNPKFAKLIERNLQVCSVHPGMAKVIRSSVYDLDYSGAKTPADIVFVDPPYAMTSDARALSLLFDQLEKLSAGWMTPGVKLVLHHAPGIIKDWPSVFFGCYDSRIYGRSQLSFFSITKESGREAEKRDLD